MKLKTSDFFLSLTIYKIKVSFYFAQNALILRSEANVELKGLVISSSNIGINKREFKKLSLILAVVLPLGKLKEAHLITFIFLSKEDKLANLDGRMGGIPFPSMNRGRSENHKMHYENFNLIYVWSNLQIIHIR